MLIVQQNYFQIYIQQNFRPFSKIVLSMRFSSPSGTHPRYVANNKFDTVTMRSLRAGNDGAFRHEANCNAPPAFLRICPICNNERAMHHPI